ncbi:MAG: gliding motility-associated C-terminal domain-containing protein [Cryomorphaceae bacterium]|nr:gliding motility-associated C-terminal domain-containing protein [Cryomorphaceae bacterium]
MPKRGLGYSGFRNFTYSPNGVFPSLSWSINQSIPFNGLDSGEVYILEFYYRNHPLAGFHNRHASVFFSFDSSNYFFNNVKYFDILLDSNPPDDFWKHLKVDFVAQGKENFFILGNPDGNLSHTSSVANSVPQSQLPRGYGNTHNAIWSRAAWLIDDIHLYKASDTLFSVHIGRDTILCYHDTLILTATPAGFKLEDTITTWLWNTGHTTENISVTEPGIYSVEVTINQTYKAYDTILVEFEPFPVWPPPFNRVLVICKESFNHEKVVGPFLTRGGNYYWSSGDNEQSAYFIEPGFYSLRVITPCYDQSRDFEIVNRFCMDIEPYIPSAFTPFGKNPQWIIGGIEKNTEVQVYNRWGQRVFYSDNYLDNWWDGTYNGKPVPSGIYTYRIVAHYEGRNPIMKTGTVSIIW